MTTHISDESDVVDFTTESFSQSQHQQSQSQLTFNSQIFSSDVNQSTISDVNQDPSDKYFEPLIEKQLDIFRSTLPVYSETEDSKQEIRQTCLVQKPKQVTVHVAREEFLHIRATITVTFIPDAAQGAWADFLNDCRSKLGIDFIDKIYDKFDHSPVHRVLRLQDGGHYVVRQREESSVLEVIQSGVRPGKIIWPITKFINGAKDMLVDLEGHQPGMESRVERLVSLPQIRSRQRKICQKLMKSTTPNEIMKVMLELVEYRNPMPSDPPEVVEAIEKDNKKKLDGDIDYICIYRLFFECLNRVAVRGYMEEAGENSTLTYILNLIERLKDEVDIVVLGMKLISDMVKSLALRTDEIFHVIMNCAQHYSPPCQKGYERVIKRNIPSPEEVVVNSMRDVTVFVTALTYNVNFRWNASSEWKQNVKLKKLWKRRKGICENSMRKSWQKKKRPRTKRKLLWQRKLRYQL